MSVGRYAPSPTGDLHVGNAFAAVVTWARARTHVAHGERGRCLLRIEDLDTPRVVAGAAAGIVRDCAALGLSFDPFVANDADVDAAVGDGVVDGIVWQSRRTRAYGAALQALVDEGLVFACRCSRKDLQRAPSAPHVGDEGPVYPGTCRDAGIPLGAPDVALRVRVDRLVQRFGDAGAGAVVVVDDAWQGRFAHDVEAAVGDFVVRRRDGLFSYQLAVVVDDRWQGVTEVVRGADLLSSSPRQVLLHRALAAAEGRAPSSPPSFAHLPLFVDVTGHRLSKRSPQAPELLRTVLERVSPARLVGHFAALLGLVDDGAHLSVDEFAALPLAGALRRPSVVWAPPP
jgi:glutamyl-Q tRNA(Asp) synthetase